jgi:hypothetical protein
MFSDSDRRAVVRAAKCFHTISGYDTLLAMAALAGLKRLQDAFDEHIKLVRDVSAGQPSGIALFWVPAEFRGDFTTAAQVQAACLALEAENPTLKESLTVLWPGASDSEVAAAWAHVKGLDWTTVALLRRTRATLSSGSPQNAPPIFTPYSIDVVGETYEMLKHELGVQTGAQRGEFFTPEPVGALMAALVAPEAKDREIGSSVLDPCCGSGRFLVLAAAQAIERYGLFVQQTGPGHPQGAGRRLVVPPPRVFVGQDIAAHGPAMGRISMTALGYLNAVFVVRNSLTEPVTWEEADGIVAARGEALLALQSGHLVTDDVRGRAVVSTPPLDVGPVSKPSKKPASRKASGHDASLMSF